MKLAPDKRSALHRYTLAKWGVFLTYLLLAYLLFGVGKDLTSRALGHGDAWTGGAPINIALKSFPMWNPYLQGGTFAYKDIGFQALYLPGRLLMSLMPTITGYNLLLLLHYAAAGLFTLLFLKELSVNRFAAFVGGLIFMFSGFMVAHQGHHAMIMAAAYLPIVLYFVERYMNSRKIRFLFMGAAAFALSILADYTAVSMYIGMVVLPYIIFRALIQPGRGAGSLPSKIIMIVQCSFIVFGLGAALAAIQILPILEALKTVTRGQVSYDFFSSFSFPFKLLPLLVFPYIYGATSSTLYRSTYFGPWNLTEMTGYMGILPSLFAVLAVALFFRRNKQILFWLVVAVLGFILSLGSSTPVYKLMFHVPVYNMFRASARNWMEVNFAIAVLASFFIHYMKMNPQFQKRKYLLAVSMSAAVLLLIVLFILLVGKKMISTPELREKWIATSRITTPEVYIPLLIILMSILLLYGLYFYDESKAYWVLVVAVIYFDFFSYGYFFHGLIPPYKILQHDTNPLAEFLLSNGDDESQYRIWGLNMEDPDNQIYPNVNLLYGIQSVSAYSNMWLKDYRDMTTFEVNGVSKSRYQLLQNSKVLSTLSTKYIITSRPEDKQFMQNLMIGEDVKPVSVVVEGFSNPAWQFISPLRMNQDIATLKSNKGDVSLIQIPFMIQPRTFYRVTFKARITGQLPDSELTLDIAGENYDNREQEASFSSLHINDYYTRASLSREFEEYSVDFYSGEVVPDSAILRFYTWSKQPYQIKDVQLMQVEGMSPSFGLETSNNGSPKNLYVKRFESPDGIAAYENLNFLPRARFVENVITVNNATVATDIFWNSSSFNPAKTALVESFSGNSTFDDGEVINVDYSNNNAVVLSVKTGNRSFLVLSDTWYPGWKAFIDDRETQIYKTNVVSRGVIIEGEGQHTVKFVFLPRSFYLGVTITCLTLIVMVTGSIIDEKKKVTDTSHSALKVIGNDAGIFVRMFEI